MGVQSGRGLTARVIAIYPRRPKVLHTGDDHIAVKFNDSLFRAASIGEELRLPVMAGVPLASSLVKLALDARRMWFRLYPSGVGDAFVMVDLSEGIRHTEGSIRISVVPEDALLKLVLAETEPQPWEDIVRKLSIFKRLTRGPTPWFGSGYAPFFVAVVDRAGVSVGA